jgi:DNA-directed RNA polymerase subunit E'/Rpb7
MINLTKKIISFFKPAESNLQPPPTAEPTIDNTYLQVLLDAVIKHQEADETVKATITKTNKLGFTVKVCGLYGYLPYSNMPWTYTKLNYWLLVAPSIVDYFFIGKIALVANNPIKVIIDATGHNLKPYLLEVDKMYTGIILEKKRFGLIIEIGNHFNWKSGSIKGLIHKNFLENRDDYTLAQEGQSISTHYVGMGHNNKYLFGDFFISPTWNETYLETLVGTVQQATVTFNKLQKREYYIEGKYQCTVAILKALQPTPTRRNMRSYLKTLKDGDTIQCEVLSCNHKKKRLTIKLIGHY